MSAQNKQGSKLEFRVSVDGIALPTETRNRIAQAIQKAVLAEIAGIDLKQTMGVRFIGNGGTQGIEVVAKMAEGPR